jgi:pimeloyl-ACP methyl ester carboxylesterase
MTTQRFTVDSGDGWTLDLRRHVDPARHNPDLHPVVMVPGYAMNSFILGFHPSGLSMMGYLAEAGFELWTTDMRGQGESRRRARSGPLHLGDRFGLGELALMDLPAMLARIRAETASTRQGLLPVGCSLGASILYAYLAHHRQDHGLVGMVAVGGPLRWEAVHPAMRLAFASPRLAGLLPFAGTRALARGALPLVKHAPSLLSLYMNAHQVDLSQADQLVRTVEDPVPYINRQVARWVQDKDLVVRGVNTSQALKGLDLDLLCILANRDGIVPAAAARSVASILGPERVDVLEVGDAKRWYAHADLFIGPQAQQEVFEPLRAWLVARG